jgi:hypothetical protein
MMFKSRSARPSSTVPALFSFFISPDERDDVNPDELSRALSALAERVGRLRPSSHDPESYHVERDEIRAELKRLAGEVRASRIETRAPKGKFTAGAIRVDGRGIAVERRGDRRRTEPRARASDSPFARSVHEPNR